ncbi:diguanylate cyclase [Methylosinus sp. R-45379]|uniref:GGDEF domain-containing protein n=1 Tax=unclassified Methylosinus TaxID=2624500 RepID=UPI0004670D97|nr:MULTISPECIES: GGDEF domain-containing protein [unclassified Methylosinus]OAI27983.1 diguanylate cyclase [Methylosinus sp. R-45379]TDX66990.1 diguanylate cyclase (GGDEF)-like protein [Methylosinus sp. sav-2]
MIALAPTLYLFGAFMLSLLGVFLYAIWRGDEEAEELWWWAAVFATAGASALCYAFRNEVEWLSIIFGNALTLWACGLLWTGILVFVGEPVRPLLALLGGVIWAAGLWRADIHFRISEISAISAIYEIAAAVELFRYNRIGGQRLVVSRVTAWIIALQAGIEFTLAIAAPFIAVDEASFLTSPYQKYRFLELSGFIAVLGFLLATLSKERLAKRREVAAMIDPLTGLPNRRAFDRAVERSKRSAPAPSTAVLVFDLDNFKYINDRFGHAEGDRVLAAFGATATRNTRANDMLARIGGEEFIAILSPADRTSALVIAERIRSAFIRDAAHLADGAATVSVGVTVLENAQPDLAVMTRVADDALYRAKAEGRNRVIFASVQHEPKTLAS